MSPALRDIISQVIQVAAVAIGAWFVHRFGRPSQKDRAQHLALIANDVVNLLLAKNPKATWAALLQVAVHDITTAAGLDVTDPAAIERAAAQALTERGVRP